MKRPIEISLVAVWVMALAFGQQPGEQQLSGSAEAGYRWTTNLAGSHYTYRSVVDLGEGPKLLDFDLAARPTGRSWWDRLLVSGGSWGGDPYNHARGELERFQSYRFLVDYRNLTYFNFLPSFANPQLAGGLESSQRTFDSDRRLVGIELELLPGKRVSPYLGYRRDAGRGYGITPFVENGNEYPFRTRLWDQTDEYRGGVQFNWPRWNLTLEQGGTAFKDDQSVYSTGPSFGNRTTPLLGNLLRLDALNQAYRVRGRSLFSRATLSAAPAEWLDVTARFLFSQPRCEVEHRFDEGGLLYWGATRFLTGRAGFTSAEAKMPRTSGTATVELHPRRWLRLRESWWTYQFHSATSGLWVETLIEASLRQELRIAASDRLVYRSNQQQLEVLVSPRPWWTIRGGHRYEWGDATVRGGTLGILGNPELGELKRHVALAGLHVRPNARWRTSLDYEVADTERSYFRTSLHDYHRLRIQTQWEVTSNLRVAGGFRLLDNQKRSRELVPDLAFDQRFQASFASVEWRPQGGERLSLIADYSRIAVRVDTTLIRTEQLAPGGYRHRENGHLATALVDCKPMGPEARGVPQLQLGGSLYVDSGSRPANYYQPVLRLILPVHRSVAGFAEWRYYGLGQAFYELESFRIHHVLAGLRLNL